MYTPSDPYLYRKSSIEWPFRLIKMYKAPRVHVNTRIQVVRLYILEIQPEVLKRKFHRHELVEPEENEVYVDFESSIVTIFINLRQGPVGINCP